MRNKVTITKTDALRIVYKYAPIYKDYLSGRNLLFICTDKYKNVSCLEVLFTASRFLHLTGFQLKTGEITPDDFLERCIQRRLSLRDFDFNSDGTTELKMRALPLVMCSDLGANMVGDYNNQRPKLYTEKIAGGVNACMGFVRDGGDGPFVPNTMLDSDIRDETERPLRIVATFSKSIADQKYEDIVRLGKNVDWNRLQFPEEYLYLLPLIQAKLNVYNGTESSEKKEGSHLQRM